MMLQQKLFLSISNIKQEFDDEGGVQAPATAEPEQNDAIDVVSQCFPGMEGILAADSEPMPVEDVGQENEELFDEDYSRAKSDITKILNNIAAKRGPLKRKFKLSYPSTITSLESHAEKHGFPDNELMNIWSVATSPHVNANCTQRRRLLFSMVPTMVIKSEIIEQIVTWLVTASKGNFKPTVVTGVYQLLCMYAEYAIIDDDKIYYEYILNQLLKAHVTKSAIPWQMFAFRNMVTPSILNKNHIFMLINLLNAKDAKKTHIEDVNASIWFCQQLRPDLFELGSTALNGKLRMRMLNIPGNIRGRFYNCMMRIKSVDLPNQHPLFEYVFPEFLPAFGRMDIGKKRTSLTDKMLQCLETEEGSVKLALDPVYLDVFSEWLRNVLLHRFQGFDLPRTREDALRYIFLLDRCHLITTIHGKGLEVINTWLAQMIPTWNFSMLQDIVFLLLPFIEPKHILPFAESICQTLKDKFICCNWTSLYIWKWLSGLMITWLKESYVVNSEGYDDGIRWLFNLLGDLSYYVATNRTHQHELTQNIFVYYNWIFMKKSEILKVISTAEFNSFSVRLLNCFVVTHRLDYLLGACDAAKIELQENKDLLDAISYVSNGILSNNLALSVLKDCPTELKVFIQDDFDARVEPQLNTISGSQRFLGINMDTTDD